jgi:hypothetical protein
MSARLDHDGLASSHEAPRDASSAPDCSGECVRFSLNDLKVHPAAPLDDPLSGSADPSAREGGARCA